MSFTLIAQKTIPEIGSIAKLYRHDGTGARLLSLSNSDENKVFGISFRTPPSRSDGVAHIMEHSVLCGSERYPVKEPFVELIKGSLNTFLNAMTYPDKTVYPVASANLQDFRNLVDVYMDAVLHPLITEDTLRQEGWHYETDPDSGKLSYKGVVFNEMKGAYSDPDDMHADLSRRSLFPDTSYGLDSGGDPETIPQLDYDTFKAFHETYYHPSNAFIYFYGDDDPEARLESMDGWLAPYSRKDIDSMPGLQSGFTEPRRIEAVYDSGDTEDPRHWIALNWALTGHGDPLRSLGLAVLSHILTANSASPLRKALIESGLGEDLAGFGFMEELRTSAYSVGLKGVAKEGLDKAEALILDTLRRLADEGIDPETVAASLNTVEFALREKNTGRFPRGLAIMFDALNEWLYDNDPMQGLAFEEPLAELARLAEAGGYFEGLIREWLLENPHRSTVILSPDPEEGQRRAARETAALEAAASAMPEAERAALAETERRLKLRQEAPDSPEALATIPSLRLEDLPRETAVPPTEFLGLGASPLLFHDLPTGSILYLDIAFDLKRLDARLLPYAGLIGRAILEMGAGEEDFVRISQRIGKDTGGIRTANFTATMSGSKESSAKFFVRAKALVPKAGLLFELLRKVLLEARLDDKERFRQIVLEEKAQAEASVIPAGHRLVGLRLASRFTESDWASERLGGLERLFFLRSLAARIDADWEGVLADLEAVRGALIDRNSAVFNVTTDAASFATVRPGLEAFAASLPAGRVLEPSWTLAAVAAAGTAVAGPTAVPAAAAPAALEAVAQTLGPEGLVAPSQVNFVGKAFQLRAGATGSNSGTGAIVKKTMPDATASGARDSPVDPETAGAWMVVCKYLDTAFLWEKVRVQGGAYGGFSSFNLNSGVFLFLSYRDPNLAQTLEIYDRTAGFLKKLDIHPDELRKSIIGAIGDMDSYLLPDAKGFTALLHWLTGYDTGTRQRVRNGILGASKADFRRLGEALDAAAPNAISAALGREDMLEKGLRSGNPGYFATRVL